MWTTNDKKFLRTMGIASSDPPAPLPRFRVEPPDAEGQYRVIDAKTPRSKWTATFATREAAEACANEMNGKGTKTS
jgi:hypothetical protein